jgi:acylphosphatase
MDDPTFQLHAIVTGHVQGVGFRSYVFDRANFLNLTGWVRNTYNGDVEVCAEGPRGDLDTLLAALRKGPYSATVIDVREQWEQPSGKFSRFLIIPTS